MLEVVEVELGLDGDLKLERELGERALTLAGITLDGVALNLDDVLADVTIRHGRTGFFDSASPSTCQVTLVGVDRATSSAVTLAQTLVVNVSDGTTTFPRFTGRTTDATLERDQLTLVAVGALARMQSSDWDAGMTLPATSWTVRVYYTLLHCQGVGTAQLVQDPTTPLGNPPLAAQAVAQRASPSPWELLSSYLDYLGATVADLPDGRILVQPAESRTTASAVAIPPSDVLYTPTWVMVLPGANEVWFDVDTADQAHGLDAASRTQYGLRELTFETTIVPGGGHSNYLAQAMVDRQAKPAWVIEAATLLSGRPLAIGQPLHFTGFPPAAPHGSWTAIVEGWTDRIVSAGERLDWTIELSLSDPKLSGLGAAAIKWDEAPSDLTWDSANPATSWDAALTLDDLYP